MLKASEIQGYKKQTDQVSKEQESRTQVPKKLLATENPVIVIPAVVVKPVPVPDPTVDAPADIIDSAGNVGTAPSRKDKVN
ncbi:MAG: hypothetical protein Q7J14_00070, partial [Candidatus Magasanikbacteria bacterium]|nr:hypothetical protein [Candidatus Magasanikbacteria bacterium]